jgi:hypothetical protein
MFTGPEIVETLESLQVTHVVWLPDSSLGLWEEALDASPKLELIRVCREGEAWPLAAGLHVGGKTPVIMMQTTGFFESGDAMRNIVLDLRLPLFAVVGVRNWLISESRDSAKLFAEPIAQAWGFDPVWVAQHDDKPNLAQHYRDCRQTERPGFVFIAEGKG